MSSVSRSRSTFLGWPRARVARRAGSGALYAKGQSPLHVAVSRRYFEQLMQGEHE